MPRSHLTVILAALALVAACTGSDDPTAGDQADPAVIEAGGIDPGLAGEPPTAGGLVVVAEPRTDGGELVVSALDGTVRNRTPLTQAVQTLVPLGDTSDVVLVVLERGVVTYAASSATLAPTALPPADWRVVAHTPGLSLLRGDGRLALLDALDGSVIASPELDLEDPLDVILPAGGAIALVAGADGTGVRIDARTGAVQPLGAPVRLGSADAAGRRTVRTALVDDARQVVVEGHPGPFRSSAAGTGAFAVLDPAGTTALVFDQSVRAVDLGTGRGVIYGPLDGPVFDAFVAPSGEAAVWLERGEHSTGRFLDLTGPRLLRIESLASSLPMPGQRPGNRVVWFGGLLGDGPLVAVDTETGDHTVFDDEEVGFVGFPPGAISPTGAHAAFAVLEGGLGGVVVYDVDGRSREILTGPGLTRPRFGPGGAGLLTLRLSGPEDAFPTAQLTDLAGTVIRDLGEVAGAAWVSLR